MRLSESPKRPKARTQRRAESDSPGVVLDEPSRPVTSAFNRRPPPGGPLTWQETRVRTCSPRRSLPMRRVSVVAAGSLTDRICRGPGQSRDKSRTGLWTSPWALRLFPVVRCIDQFPPYFALVNTFAPFSLGRYPAISRPGPGRVGDGMNRIEIMTTASLGDTSHLPVGEVVPFGTRLELVLPEPGESAADEAMIQLLRIGGRSAPRAEFRARSPCHSPNCPGSSARCLGEIWTVCGRAAAGRPSRPVRSTGSASP